MKDIKTALFVDEFVGIEGLDVVGDTQRKTVWTWMSPFSIQICRIYRAALQWS